MIYKLSYTWNTGYCQGYHEHDLGYWHDPKKARQKLLDVLKERNGLDCFSDYNGHLYSPSEFKEGILSGDLKRFHLYGTDYTVYLEPIKCEDD